MFEKVVGQENAKKVLGSMIQSGTIPHALLFAGPYGVGKIEMARELARMLLCQNGPESGCTTCHACYRAMKLEHPDLHILFPFRDAPKNSEDRASWADELAAHRKILGEELYAPVIYEKSRQIVTVLVSEVQERLLESSFEGGRKVCVILNAERLNQKTGNSLLKILEEPPDGVYFILTTEQLSSVLPTIVSRSSVVRFRRLKAQEIRAYLETQGKLEPEKIVSYGEAASGSLKTAKSLAYENKATFLTQSLELYIAVALAEPEEVVTQVMPFVRSKDNLEAEEILNSFSIFTQSVLEHSLGITSRNRGSGDLFALPGGSVKLPSLHKLSERLEEGLEMLSRNVNISTVMWSVFNGINSAYRD
jgi:DNA polymerase-3 subunit delta'